MIITIKPESVDQDKIEELINLSDSNPDLEIKLDTLDICEVLGEPVGKLVRNIETFEGYNGTQYQFALWSISNYVVLSEMLAAFPSLIKGDKQSTDAIKYMDYITDRPLPFPMNTHYVEKVSKETRFTDNNTDERILSNFDEDFELVPSIYIMKHVEYTKPEPYLNGHILDFSDRSYEQHQGAWIPV